MPALYLDTLKVSTVEKTADNTWAQGGHGNSRLINWDYNKQINVTLEDALCTPASLGLCWNGILSADWKDGKVNYDSDVCYCKNPLTKVSRMEKAKFPRQDTTGGIISNLLPKVKNDMVDDGLGILKISSIVDGTDIHGTGMVNNHTYRWKMAIESAVKSIAVVPDRFFDVKGKSYSIDWNRKVSVDSLPDYENYKSAIIYRINTRTENMVPPVATIIYDNEMQNRRGAIKDLTLTVAAGTVGTFSLGELLANGRISGFNLYDGGYFVDGEELVSGKVYFPLRSLDQTFAIGEEDEDITVTVFALNSYGIKKYITTKSSKVTIYNVNSTLVNYLQNHATTNIFWDEEHNWTDQEAAQVEANESGEYTEDNGGIKAIADVYGSVKEVDTTVPIREGNYLAIIIDNNDNYHALIGVVQNLEAEDEDDYATSTVVWFKPETDVNLTQFKGLDMWIRFESINEMIYFMLTKYEQDIFAIKAATIHPYANNTIDKDEEEDGWYVNKNRTQVTENSDLESKKLEGKLWAYVNPRTMQPYSDDYWFHFGEPYYIKSLTLAPEGKQIKGNQIIVKADQWPGMYMVIGETYIRNRDTNEDERMQIKFPQCKVKSDQTLTLSADGEPTTFNLDLEVAQPRTGHMMEITTYEVATKMVEGENGCFYAVDGSSEVLSE